MRGRMKKRVSVLAFSEKRRYLYPEVKRGEHQEVKRGPRTARERLRTIALQSRPVRCKLRRVDRNEYTDDRQY